MTKYEKALLDVIAYAEGTLGLSNNGYDITFGKWVINGWTEDTKIVHGGSDWAKKFDGGYSAAAGRYQFVYNTWTGGWVGGTSEQPGPNLPLTKANQDAAALRQIKVKHEVSDSQLEGLTNIDTFASVMNTLAIEWASLPTSDGSGYYEGQGGHDTAGELYDVFMIALARY